MPYLLLRDRFIIYGREDGWEIGGPEFFLKKKGGPESVCCQKYISTFMRKRNCKLIIYKVGFIRNYILDGGEDLKFIANQSGDLKF